MKVCYNICMDKKDKIKEAMRLYVKKKRMMKTLKYYIDNREKIKKRSLQYYCDNKEEIAKKRKAYYKIPINATKKNNYQKQYWKKYRKERMANDIVYNLNSRMTVSIRYALGKNKNGNHWEKIVGYTAKDLKKHLENTMPSGYTWNDYIDGKLHIDHIIPRSVFVFQDSKDSDFLDCWCLDNLQLL